MSMPELQDSFLPQIQCVFYATFHEQRGPHILYQVPEGIILQSSSSSGFTGLQSASSRSVTNSRLDLPYASSSNSSAAPSDGAPTTTESPSPMYRSSNTNSVSSIDTSTVISSPSSPVSFRSPNTSRLPPLVTTSPYKHSASPTQGMATPLLNFSDISRFVIPTQDMCGRLIICSTQKHRVIGFPVCLEGEKYKRVHFRYNLCFVFERTADLSCYEPIVRKISRVLMACEEESAFLSDPTSSTQIHSILEQLYEDLNSYHETSIVIDQFNSIELKVFPFYPNPPVVYDWTVPLALINFMDLIEPNWDITMARVCPHIDGVNHVSRIACLADCDLELTRQAISHLLYYQCIMTIDVFQYNNIYALTRSIQWLADDPIVKDECGPYVTKPGHDIPDWPHLLFLYSRLKPGKTVLEWAEEHNVFVQGIDVRRFMTFGVIKGFLRRIHRWPILLPKKPPQTPIIELAEERVLSGATIRRRGKSLSTANPPNISPTNTKARERSRSQSQAQSQTLPKVPTPLQRKLTEAEEYARAVQLRGDPTSTLSPPEAPPIMPRPPVRRGSGIAHEIAESRRLSSLAISGPDSPKLKRQPSGTFTPVVATSSAKRRTPDFSNTPHNSNSNPSANANLLYAYPPELPKLLDGTHHTDELGTRFGTGWPTIEKWLSAIGGGEQPGDYGRVVVIHR